MSPESTPTVATARWSCRLALFSVSLILVALALHRFAALTTPLALNLFLVGLGGAALAFLITGSFVIEYIFSVPGIGRAYVTSISYRDYSMIMAMTMFYAVVIVFLNLAVDVLYAYIDPRIRYS